MESAACSLEDPPVQRKVVPAPMTPRLAGSKRLAGASRSNATPEDGTVTCRCWMLDAISGGPPTARTASQLSGPETFGKGTGSGEVADPPPSQRSPPPGKRSDEEITSDACSNSGGSATVAPTTPCPPGSSVIGPPLSAPPVPGSVSVAANSP